MSTLSAVHAHPLHVPHLKHLHPIEAIGAMFHIGTRPERLHYPPDLSSFLENAALAREMRRL